MFYEVVPFILLAIVIGIPIGVMIVKYVKLSSEEKASISSEVQAKREAFKNPVNADGEVICPWCGSKQIQAVPRKWSVTAGLLTNKVDRFCLKCKKRF